MQPGFFHFRMMDYLFSFTATWPGCDDPALILNIYEWSGFPMAYLMVKSGEWKGRRIDLDKEKTILGRADTADVCVQDRNVSRHHAQVIMRESHQAALMDLGSSNGTFVNEVPVSRVLLMDGDEIRLGETLMVFHEKKTDEEEERPATLPLEVHTGSSRIRTPLAAGQVTAVHQAGGSATPLETLKETYQQLRALYRTLSDMNAAENLNDMFRNVGDAFLISLGVDRVAFYAKSSEQKEPEIHTSVVNPSFDATSFQRDYPVHREVLECIREDLEPTLFTEGEPVNGETLHPEVMAAPILCDGQLRGILYVDSPRSHRPLGKNELDFATTVCGQLGTVLQRLSALDNLKRRNKELLRVVNGEMAIVCRNKKMMDLLEAVNQLAETDTTVLLRGESGTGKELFARAIHASSRRGGGQMICVNCASLPDTLIESELFGYERGAFTGAVARKPGKFELANGGTLFLDEIGDISLAAQAKILRALQDGEITRVGGTQTMRVDVRVIAATNKDLEYAIRKGEFREDLYYRIRVVELAIPPLRERPEDIPVLAEYFLQTLRARTSSKVTGFSAETLAALSRYIWPGNVRELRNVVERALVFARREQIQPHHLPPELLQSRDQANDTPEEVVNTNSIPLSLSELERRHIEKTLVWAEGNKVKTAEALGISRSTLYEKMKQYEINL